MGQSLTTLITHFKKSLTNFLRYRLALRALKTRAYAINTFMKYTAIWTTESSTDDPWHQWLAINALSGLEYQLLYWSDHIELEFYDQDRAVEFATEFGL